MTTEPGGQKISENSCCNTQAVEYSLRMTTNATQTVKIGKTTYKVVSATAYSRPGTVWTLRKGNESKTLIYDEQNASFTLWSGRCNLPKLVNVEFAR